MCTEALRAEHRIVGVLSKEEEGVDKTQRHYTTLLIVVILVQLGYGHFLHF